MKFFHGNLLKTICSYVYDEQGYWKNEGVNTNIFFVKTDWIHDFLENKIPNYPFKLITHNSDYAINESHLYGLNNQNLLKWFAQEIDIDHPKLFHIPTGLPNERVLYKDGPLEHFHFGARKVFSDIMFSENNKKKLMAEITFDVNTNKDRTGCLDICNKMGMYYKKLNYTDYLNDIKESMFCISPNGSRPESHRVWECLHLKCVPIVVPSPRPALYKEFPVILLNNWKDLLTTELNKEVYYKYMSTFDIQKLNGSFVLDKILKM